MRGWAAGILIVLLATFGVGVEGSRARAADPGDGADAKPYRVTPHFRFFGDEDVETTLDNLAGTAEERLARLCAPIGACDRLTRPIDVWVAADAERFAASFPEPNPMSEWAAGVTFLKSQRIVLRRHGTAVFTLSETFDHEVAHVLAETFATSDNMRALPRWFAEGLAIWQAGEGLAGRLDEAIRAASTGHLLTFEDLERDFPNEGTRVGIAYAQSALFVQRLARSHGPKALAGVLADVGSGTGFATAFEARFGEPAASLFDRQAEELERSSTPFTLFADGNVIWSLMTVLFIFAAWWRMRDRKRQMARLADSEDQRIAEEDMALLGDPSLDGPSLAQPSLAEPSRLAPPRPEDDPKNWN